MKQLELTYEKSGHVVGVPEPATAKLDRRTLRGWLPELVGKRFGRLTVLARLPATKDDQNRKWLCRCDCGKEVAVRPICIKSGSTVSCGCYQREELGDRKRAHGMVDSPTYRSWEGAKARCTNPNDIGYEYYGGRGIKMCERWANSFVAFLEDMGERPEGMTIDRKDPNGNYEPGNCRWATEETQANNKRNNRHLTWQGETLTVSQWARRTGIGFETIVSRLERGWSIGAALTKEPVVMPKVRSLVKVVCQRCGQLFEVPAYRKDDAKFCSYRCYWNKQP